MKKKTIANLVMVIIICAIAAGGVLGVGYIRGWFDAADEATALLSQVKGTVNIERGGVIYPVEGDTVLRADDKITTLPGASAVIVLGSDTITLGGDVELVVDDPAAANLSLLIQSGEVFVNTEQAVQLSFELGMVTVENATAALSVRSSAQTVSVFRGAVGTAQAGQTMEYVGGQISIGALKLESLNDFLVSQIRKTNSFITLCFTNQDLDDLEAKRQQAIQDLINQAKPTQPSDPDGTGATQPAFPDADGYVYLSILCETILDNMDNLTPGKEEFVPADGVILPMVEVPFYEGETVFEVLNRICELADIQIEYSWTPMYDSYYIEGINHLYEFDCGEQSGWMYKVNEWFPNYGCSSYELSDGDVIVWCYTCVGLGADVGDDWMAHE